MKKKKSDSFDDISKDIDRLLEKILGSMSVESIDDRPKQFMYGFTMVKKPGEAPEIREFGDVSLEGKSMNGNRKPLIDLFDMEDEIKVVAEMPGVEKEDIRAEISDNDLLDIRAYSGGRRYSEHVVLPGVVQPEISEINYKNGVLEIKIQKKVIKKRG